MNRIFIHLPAYREPELVPTIKDALAQAKYPERIHFGICRQYNPEDGFDNVDEFRNDPRFHIYDMPYEQAKGLAYARSIINEQLLTDQEFVLQLDAHHRFTEHWDETLLTWYYQLKDDGHNPLLCGYLPYYNPYNDPADRVQEPWYSEPAAFYPHGTIFIRPTGFSMDWRTLDKPVPARFISGHFCFGPNKWAKEIRHDPEIFFAGEEINLTVRSYTHGYDLFHPHRVVIWHATMREERSGKLVWDDQHKRGQDMWWKQNDKGRAKIRKLLRVEENDFNLTGYDLGNVRSLRQYEIYAGIHFKQKAFQTYTKQNKFPPNPVIHSGDDWEKSFSLSYYHLVNITRNILNQNDYEYILIAYDDEEGRGIHSLEVRGDDLKQFINNNKTVHFENIFNTDVSPSRVVYWGYSSTRGWAEREEITL
jgi:hypothetical protein